MRVVIADDSVLFREGLVKLLEGVGFEVAGRAADGEELLALVETKSPDLVIADIRMPPAHSVEGLHRRRREGQSPSFPFRPAR